MVKRDAGGKKGKLLCCKRIFDGIKANLAEIQLKKHQNVQKTYFLQRVPGVNGLTLKGRLSLRSCKWTASLQIFVVYRGFDLFQGNILTGILMKCLCSL